MPRSSASPAVSTIRRAYEAVVYVLSFGVLVNAVIAGRALIGEWDIVVHGVIGNGVFVLAVAAMVLALLGRADRLAMTLTVVLAVLVFAQVGLGYTGRTNLEALAWHVANGVLLFGVATWTAARSSLIGLRASG